MTWYHPALAERALAESDTEITKLRADNERLRADNERLLRGIRSALDYLNEARDGDASFNLEALLAGSTYEQSERKP